MSMKASLQQRLPIWGIISAALVGIVLILVLLERREATSVVEPDDTQQVRFGQEVYAANCAACHGANLEGQAGWQDPPVDGVLKAPPHDETGHTWHHDDTSLIEAIKEGGARLPESVGLSPMPAFKETLSEEAIMAVLAYIKSEWPEEIRAAQSAR